MSEEVEFTTAEETVDPAPVCEEEVKVEAVAEEPAAEAEAESEPAPAPEPEQTMDDLTPELEASYKKYSEKKSRASAEMEGPLAEKWAQLEQMLEDQTVVSVKIKEAVKGGVLTYVNDVQGFIPASQISTKYVEKLDDWVGQRIDVVPITVDPSKKRLVLSGRAVQKQKEEAEKAEKLAAIKVGSIVEGTVDGIKDYGAFIKLDSGVSGLLHVSQISRDHIKDPGAVLKTGQRVTCKVIKVDNGKISLSMKSVPSNDEKSESTFRYKETGSAVTGLGDLLKDIKL